ncbi:formate dehydrogenase major subunit [Paramicrobacterium humi]|uniref:Formate dehydrogenase major subunit n=1 Tax=Paramicrobacterium humi TaxID=640635 RepID=A0A1H4M8Z4_9MICO|nr:FdhF/YdeP family oxidoreductase [Microbacterium humi]SEB79561.1 formate dehydrogenase major subunit [Microbacterium humi]
MSEQEQGREAADANLEVDKPKDWAAGVPGIAHAMGPAFKDVGVTRSLKGLLTMNQKDGFDCMSCAWEDPPERKTFEFCENGAKAFVWEATPLVVKSEFWDEHPLADLETRDDYWLGQQGRLSEPVYKAPGDDRYRPVSWERAFQIVADELHDLDSPDEAAFYTSGRTANETAFLYQLFVRAFGTNNLPDCSNMCHESTGAAMGETVGVGKSTVRYEDFAKADLIIIMGQNPGTNHPRMLTALEEAKEAGAKIVAVNPLPEAGLKRYKNPQKVRGIIGRGTDLADQFLQVKLAGDMALLQAVSKRVIDADAVRGGILDHAFINRYCIGFEEFRDSLSTLDEQTVLDATGVSSAEIDELAEGYMTSERVIITWAMGLTQHEFAVPTIKEIINLLMLRGNIGRPGAGASPIRGHSNVQGDRTMGIWEKMPHAFLDALEAEFGIEVPHESGLDAVGTVRAMRDGKVKVLTALGGNFVKAISDTGVSEAALRNTRLSVQISTKLNRSHAVIGESALILPVLGRSEIDVQATGEQFVTVEDTVAAIHASKGNLPPVAPNLLSEVSVVTRLARAVLGAGGPIDWAHFEHDYDSIREHIANVVPGCDDFNKKVRAPGGFDLPHGPRDNRTFPTASGKAQFSVNELRTIEVPPGRLLLQSLRSHDQFNTTIYSNNDRYRGVKNGRQVIFVNPDDLASLGIDDGQAVDIHGEWTDGVDRVARGFRVISYPTARGCVATYFPEANVLVPLDFTAHGSNTPVSKSIIVRLEPTAA